MFDEELVDITNDAAGVICQKVAELHDNSPQEGTLAFMIGAATALGYVIAVYSKHAGVSPEALIERATETMRESAEDAADFEMQRPH